MSSSNHFYRRPKYITTEYETKSVLTFLENVVGGFYITFDRTSLRDYFLSRIDRPIIPCNASYERFQKEMANYSEYAIFLSPNYCQDSRILEIIHNTNNIIVQ